jgi:Peptidase A4 family
MSDNTRYSTYDIVPAGYDLLNAPAERLEFYGIPQRPNVVDAPALANFWTKLVSEPFTSRIPTFSSSLGPALSTVRSLSRTHTSERRSVGSQRGTLESSLNWSGGILSPPSPKRIVFAVGGWTVPTVTQPTAPALFTRANDSIALIWVGIDGHNARLPKASLPQIGTFQKPGEPSFAWWYWWGHHATDAVTRIDDFAIVPGDEILAGVTVMAGGDVRYFIKNQNSGEFRTFLGRHQPLGEIEPLGSSAEWVVERPTDPYSKDLHPLASYGSVDFNYCLALAADKPNAPSRLMTLADNGRMIKLREAFAEPFRTIYVSRAKRRHDPDGSIGITCTFHEPT